MTTIASLAVAVVAGFVFGTILHFQRARHVARFHVSDTFVAVYCCSDEVDVADCNTPASRALGVDSLKYKMTSTVTLELTIVKC